MSLRIGGTPLYPAPGLRQELGLRHLWLKDDTLNPGLAEIIGHVVNDAYGVAHQALIDLARRA